MMKMMQILSVSVSGLAALIVAAPEVSASLNKQTFFIDDGSDELSIYTHTHDSFRQTHLVSEPSPLFSQPTYPPKEQEASRLEIREHDTGNRWPHRLGSEQRDLLGTISLAETDGPTASVASVCFITDAGNCTGAAGVGMDDTPTSSGGPGDWDLDGQQQCINSGYDCTPCPEGQKPLGTCPFYSSCHATCVNACPVENTLTCTGPDEAGVGDACDGLYASCCKLCSDYPYDEIKAGYVLTDSCKDCDGNTHYKLKCDVGNIGSGSGSYFDCGESGGTSGGETCTDDETGETYYSECKCPLNQEWSTVTKECVCSSSYKYDCQGSAYASTQSGNTCDDKYSSCDCAEGFEWDAESGLCACGGTDWCTLNQDCTALCYAAQTCNGKALKCPFDTNYSICL